ncbi:DUF885 domain-containing protein [Peristeroidobacter soli]|jgi:hypothetical protein|uniref:DUF885 domain-containing protein n=1 Tax=Peristeroidobacter soli TaxID=2497877 RepID=UPI00158850C4|nr:DUF885 domain-containing protein [Peristeroidobacter soli]
MQRFRSGVRAVLAAALLASAPLAMAADAAPSLPAWVAESNKHSQILLEVVARYSPEGASSFGVEGHEAEVVDLKPGFLERQQTDLKAAQAQLETVRATVSDARVRQDIDILIKAARDQQHTIELNQRLLLPFQDIGQLVFQGFQDLLDARVDKKRQQAAVVRLRRYVGAEKGYEPLTLLARARYEERAGDSALIGPWVVEAQQYLDNVPRFMDGTEQLLKGSGLKGWQRDMKTLRKQFAEYETWARATVLPRARKTNQLPLELYADNLKNVGVDASPKDIMERALADYVQTRDEMVLTAAELAKQRNWPESDYRDVIRRLKKERIAKDQLLDLYKSRLQQIEAIVRDKRIVTLPERPAVIRLASDAESAAQPAPHVDPPRLIGNTGEPAEFVLPTSNPNAKAGAEMDDFSYEAAAWTLTAHEARPGHELQFARMLERGVSTARIVFAFNSANVEGWALYAEAVMKEHLPVEGRIGSLQFRMMREARAFLDPMLNLGQLQPEQALRFLMDEVVLSEPMAKQEVDRYTFRAPGQATSYYYGYSRLNALRTRVELAQSGRFDALAFHDFIVNQGLLPFDLLEQAVMTEFVPIPSGGRAQ